MGSCRSIKQILRTHLAHHLQQTMAVFIGQKSTGRTAHRCPRHSSFVNKCVHHPMEIRGYVPRHVRNTRVFSLLPSESIFQQWLLLLSAVWPSNFDGLLVERMVHRLPARQVRRFDGRIYSAKKILIDAFNVTSSIAIY